MKRARDIVLAIILAIGIAAAIFGCDQSGTTSPDDIRDRAACVVRMLEVIPLSADESQDLTVRELERMVAAVRECSPIPE